ncbi:hypothetical protein VNO78_24963 [Psophocarpus tetragonolobus]|uniref:Uncharacterized protein n=1 Tax=Psophocarpus tetragonolobus TaxID=3891 RepID=A0AAN9XEV5_PSOTE
MDQLRNVLSREAQVALWKLKSVGFIKHVIYLLMGANKDGQLMDNRITLTLEELMGISEVVSIVSAYACSRERPSLNQDVRTWCKVRSRGVVYHKDASRVTGLNEEDSVDIRLDTVSDLPIDGRGSKLIVVGRDK